jgi:hypothetical protein
LEFPAGLGHKAAMSEEPTGDSSTPTANDAQEGTIARLQRTAVDLYERVPLRARRNAQRLFSLAFFIVIGTVLYRQLRGTDWGEVWRSLPASPWFYILFFARFMMQPVIEALCYTAVWSINMFRYFGVLLTKLVMNFSVAGGSGDLYFLVWSVRTLRLSYKKAFTGIKDVTLLSAAAANIVAVAILGAYFAFGDLSLNDAVSPEVWSLIIGVTIVAALISLSVIVFRGKTVGVGAVKGRVLGVDSGTMWRILFYHVVRSVGVLVLLGFQWTVGLPGSVFSAWISFLVIQLVVLRTPFIPAKEFLFLSIALALSDTVDAPQAQVKAMFLADTALRQLVNIPSLITGLVWRSKPLSIPLDPESETPIE